MSRNVLKKYKNAGSRGSLLAVGEIQPRTNSKLISDDCVLNSCLIVIWINGTS